MNIIKHKNIWLILFAVLIVISIVILVLYKPKLGIDFTGGSLTEIKVEQVTPVGEIRGIISQVTEEESIVQSSGEKQFIIKTAITEQGSYDEFERKLTEKINIAEILRHDTIGSSVGDSVTKRAIYGIILALITIVLYLGYAFRQVKQAWKFGMTSILALIHDVLFTLALYSFIGYFTGYGFDAITLVAILTILGFSVHDTIVVFDRIRENLISNPQLSITENAEMSVNQTISRSLNTSLTLIVVLLAMLFLGGATIKPFVVMLIIGIGIGTYSSIFIASPILVYWIERTQKATAGK